MRVHSAAQRLSLGFDMRIAFQVYRAAVSKPMKLGITLPPKSQALLVPFDIGTEFTEVFREVGMGSANRIGFADDAFTFNAGGHHI